MRRRPPPPPPHDPNAVPPEIAAGPQIEVWADALPLALHNQDASMTSARRNWRDARREWLEEHGVDRADQCRVIPLRRPSGRA